MAVLTIPYSPVFKLEAPQGRFNYYVLGSYKQNNLGIENPTGGNFAVHDWTEQYKGFADLSYIIDDSSRISLLLSGTYSDFQIPANPDQTPEFELAGATPKNYNSQFLSENQHEQNDFAILAYQKSFENVSFQVAAFTRYSATLFTPDDKGDLIFTGLAGRVNRNILSNGVQFDASWAINDSNTLRGGFLVTEERAIVETNNLVFPVNAAGIQTSDVPFTIIGNQDKTGLYYGFYLQDEWKVFQPLTINFRRTFRYRRRIRSRKSTQPESERRAPSHKKYHAPCRLRPLFYTACARACRVTNHQSVCRHIQPIGGLAKYCRETRTRELL